MSDAADKQATRKRVVILISGRGSNMAALADAAAARDFPARIVAVIADRPEAAGLAAARDRGIETIAVDRKAYASKALHEAALLEALDRARPDLICLAGYMRLLSPAFIARYPGRILNIHPSLLPLFPGLGAHARALAAGVRLHGCSVHFVDEAVDEGAIIAQAAVPVLPRDTPETLSERVLEGEHRLYRRALALVAHDGAWLGEDGRTRFAENVDFGTDGIIITPAGNRGK